MPAKEDVEAAYEQAPRVAPEAQAAKVSDSAHCSPAVLSPLLLQAAPARVAQEALPRLNARGEWVYDAVEAEPAAQQPPEGARPAAKQKARPKGDAAPEPGRKATPGASAALPPPPPQAELSDEEKRARIAAAASALLEAPERHIGELKVQYCVVHSSSLASVR